MKNTLKWAGIGLGSLILLVVVLAAVLHVIGNRRLNQAPTISVRMINIPTDEAAIARGEHLSRFVNSCDDCHGSDFSGKVFLDEAPIGLITAPNLTSGAGGIGAEYTDEDWLRAVRHGIGSDGRALGVMPSNWYTHMSDEDMGAVIAYLKSVPPVDNELPERDIMFPGTIIFGLLEYNKLPLGLIDHSAVQPAQTPPEEPTAKYGTYLATVAHCGNCHGEQLAGRIEDTGPPLGPNLTLNGNLANWSEADFIETLRFGVTPEDHKLDPEQMPWPDYSNLSDTELKAIWAYLQSLSPRALGQNQ